MSLLLIILSAFDCRGRNPAQFNVATYNIRLLNSGDSVAGNGWDARYRAVAALAAYHEFDIFGTQEGFRRQLDDLRRELPGFDYIGAGRDDGGSRGEHSAIFYRTEMFELLDHGDFWLSETPDRPGLGWDAACPRICTWGRFRHRDSGAEFLFCNLHMDHIGTRARIESAQLVLAWLDSLADGRPAFVTGDFNVDQHSDSYAAITGSGRLADSYCVARSIYAPNGTFNGFDPDAYTESRIDHIFVTDGIDVLKYGILTDTYRSAASDTDIDGTEAPREISVRRYRARTPSDHFPVSIKIQIQ